MKREVSVAGYGVPNVPASRLSTKGRSEMKKRITNPVEKVLRAMNDERAWVKIEARYAAMQEHEIAYEQALTELSILEAQRNMGHAVTVPSLADMVEQKKQELVQK